MATRNTKQSKGLEKKGMSSILTTVLIVLFLLVIIVVAGGLLFNMMKESKKMAELEDQCLLLDIRPISCNVTSTSATISWVRNPRGSEVNVVLVKSFIRNSKGSSIGTYDESDKEKVNSILNSYEGVINNLNITNETFASVVATVVSSDGTTKRICSPSQPIECTKDNV